MFKKLMFAALAIAGAFLSNVAVAAPPPVEVLGAQPAIRSVAVSPSGKYFALVQNLPGQSALKTFDAASGQMLGGIAAGKDQVIAGVSWHSDERLILFVEELADVRLKQEGSLRGRFATRACRILSIPRDGKNPVPLLPYLATRDDYLECNALSLKGPEPDTILLTAVMKTRDSKIASKNTLESGLRIQKVNILTGKAEVVEEETDRSTFGFAADSKGRVRLRYDSDSSSLILMAKLDGSDAWTEVHRQPLGAVDAVRSAAGPREGVIAVLGFAPDPNQLYVLFWPTDRAAVGLFDMRSRKVVSTVASDPKYDVGDVIERAGRAVGVALVRQAPEQIFFADDWRKLQALLQQTYPGHRVLIGSSSDDLKRHALYIEGPQFPSGAWAVLDLNTNEASMLGVQYPGITKDNVASQQYITYAARDGLKIDAYLTLPPGGGKNLPSIVLPHGGPRARDDGGFDWLSQFFATRGYAVIQPQFRGSDGFGGEFVKAGEQQWGLKMQDDVTDAAKYLVSSGVADPNRMCIVGWSYGGYAAMAGATLTPEQYRCSIAIAGVSDLVEQLRYIGKVANWQFGVARYWRRGIGDVTRDKDKLDATSPAKLADKVRAPMLLIHGELDDVVPIFQSELMADAMKAAGKQYEFLRVSGDNHNMAFSATRIQMMKKIDEFLAKHNPAR